VHYSPTSFIINFYQNITPLKNHLFSSTFFSSMKNIHMSP